MYGVAVPVGSDPRVVEALERFAEYLIGPVAYAVADAVDRGDNAEPTAEDFEDTAEVLREALADFLRGA
jgi:hypothetical protein